MVGRAPTMMVPVGSFALAHQNILVNVVKWIGALPTTVKMVERVLLLLSTTFQHKDANVSLTMVVLTVNLTYAQTSSVAAELVLMESVNVTKATTMTKMFA